MIRAFINDDAKFFEEKGFAHDARFRIPFCKNATHVQSAEIINAMDFIQNSLIQCIKDTNEKIAGNISPILFFVNYIF